MMDKNHAPWRSDDLDDVSLLKIDIEKSEYSAIHHWIDSAARDWATHLARFGPLIDFEKSQPSIFTVSHLQLEVHTQHSLFEAWRLFDLLVDLQLLGLVHTSRDRNDGCGDTCFEWNAAHYAFFMRSELWLADRATGSLQSYP